MYFTYDLIKSQYEASHVIVVTDNVVYKVELEKLLLACKEQSKKETVEETQCLALDLFSEEERY